MPGYIQTGLGNQTHATRTDHKTGADGTVEVAVAITAGVVLPPAAAAIVTEIVTDQAVYHLLPRTVVGVVAVARLVAARHRREEGLPRLTESIILPPTIVEVAPQAGTAGTAGTAVAVVAAVAVATESGES